MLAVRDNALDMGNVKDVLLEAAKVPQHGKPAPGVRAAGDLWGGLTFHGHIRVLFIKTNSMVYICYVKYKICETKHEEKHVEKTCGKKEKTYEKKHARKNMRKKTCEKNMRENMQEKTCEKKHAKKT